MGAGSAPIVMASFLKMTKNKDERGILASSSLKRTQNKDEGPVWPVSSLKSVDFEDETASNVEGARKNRPPRWEPAFE